MKKTTKTNKKNVKAGAGKKTAKKRTAKTTKKTEKKNSGKNEKKTEKAEKKLETDNTKKAALKNEKKEKSREVQKNVKKKNIKLAQLGIGILVIILIIVIGAMIASMNQAPPIIEPNTSNNTNQNTNDGVVTEPEIFDENTPLKIMMIKASECKGCFNQLTLDDAFNLLDVPTETEIYEYTDPKAQEIIKELEIPQFPIILIDENTGSNPNHKVTIQGEEMLLVNFLNAKFPKLKEYYIFPPAQISSIVFVPNENCANENEIKIQVFEDIFGINALRTSVDYAIALDKVKEDIEIEYHYFKLNRQEFDEEQEKAMIAAYYAAVDAEKIQEFKTSVNNIYCAKEGKDTALIEDIFNCDKRPHFGTALTNEEIEQCLNEAFIDVESYQEILENVEERIEADRILAENYAVIEGETMPTSVANCQTKTISANLIEQVCSINPELNACQEETTENKYVQ